MNSQLFTCSGLIIYAVLALFPFSVSALTLQQAVQKTVDEHPLIQSAKSDKKAVEHEIDQAKAGYFPTIDLQAGYGWEQTNNPTTRGRSDGTVSYDRQESSITLRQMVFDGLATPNEVARQEARTDSKAYTVFGQSEITALDAVEAYLNVLRRRQLLDLAKDNLLVHQRTNDQIVLRSERGIGRRADSDQSKGRLALAEKNTLSEIGNLKDAETAFLKIIGQLPDDLDPIDNEALLQGLPASLDQAVDQAVENHPILKSANSDIDSAFAQHETAKAPYMPRVDIEAGASHNVDIDGIPGKNEDAYAMVRLRYNLFNGGKDLARREQTAQLINQAKDIRDNTYRQVVESMRLSWVAYETIQSQMDFFEQHMQSSIATNAAYQKQFNIGQRTLLDLLDSANEMFLARTGYTNATYDLLFAQFRILASQGGLNRYLRVALPTDILTLEQAEKMEENMSEPSTTENPETTAEINEEKI